MVCSAARRLPIGLNPSVTTPSKTNDSADEHSTQSWEDHQNTVVKLLKAGTHVNSANEVLHSTLLHRACHQGCIRTAKLLLNKGANVTMQDKNGSTPLHVAATLGHLSVIRLLMMHGGVKCLHIKDKEDLTPKDCARMKGQHDVLHYLIVTELYSTGYRQLAHGETRMKR